MFFKTAVMLVTGSDEGLGKSAIAVLRNIRLWIGLAFYAGAAVIFAWGLMRAEVTQMVPVAMGLNLLVTTIMAIVVLGESPPLVRLVGLGVLMSGIILVAST